MKYQINDKSPHIANTCFVAPSADLIGDVNMKDNASVWFNCVLRADNDTITIGENSNVQDGSILHVDPGFPIDIGANVTIGHKVMLHGCSIGEGSLVGMNAVVLNGAKIGENCIIGANTLVTENMVIEDGQMVLGSPAKVVKELDSQTIEMVKKGTMHYVHNCLNYARNLSTVS